MNFNVIGNAIFNFFNLLLLLSLSIIFCVLSFSLFYFPITVGIIVTIQDTFIHNKNYFYKTFFNTIKYVLKNYLKTSILFYVLLLVYSFLLYFATTNAVTPLYIFSTSFIGILLFCLMLVSANICILKNTKTVELISNAILIMKRHFPFIFVIIILTLLLIYLFIKISSLYLIIAFILYLFAIAYILEYGIITNYRED